MHVTWLDILFNNQALTKMNYFQSVHVWDFLNYFSLLVLFSKPKFILAKTVWERNGNNL